MPQQRQKVLAKAPSTHDPKRRFANVNYRIAKGSLDHLVGTTEQREPCGNATASVPKRSDTVC
jgi:hypothetical protein